MPLAFVPSPARASWHAGVLAFRVQALCVVLAILLAIFWTDRRYRRAGGPRGVITDVAAWAVPAGLLPAVIGLLLTGPQPPVLAAIRSWDDAIGFPGAVACGLAGAWLGCHRMRVRFPAAGRGRAAGPGPAATRLTGSPPAETPGPEPAPAPAPAEPAGPGAALGSGRDALMAGGRASAVAQAGSRDAVARRAGPGRPAPARRLRGAPGLGGIVVVPGRRGRSARIRLSPVVGAAVPALLYAHAIAEAGRWFAQRGYGKPSGLWWAVEISPAHRAPGLENFATFQPVFAYQALWDVALGIVITWLARRLALSGGQVLALGYAGYAVAGFSLVWLGIGHAPAVLRLPATSLGDIGLCVAAAVYLTRTRLGHSGKQRRREPIGQSRPLKVSTVHVMST